MIDKKKAEEFEKLLEASDKIGESVGHLHEALKILSKLDLRRVSSQYRLHIKKSISMITDTGSLLELLIDDMTDTSSIKGTHGRLFPRRGIEHFF